MKKIAMMMVIMLVSLFFVVQGFIMHLQVNNKEETFHALQDKYFSIENFEKLAL